MIRDRGTNFGTIEKNFSKRSEVAGGGVGERGKEKETEREKRSEETLYLVVSKVKYYSDFIFIPIRFERGNGNY